MALFLVQFQGKRLCPLSGADLSKLLEIGALRGQDPLYSYRDKQWYYIDECAGFAKYYDETPRSERVALPSFTPPPLDSLKIITLTEVREVEREIPIERVVEKIVEKEIPIQVEVERIVEREVPVHIEKIVEREVPVEVRVEVEVEKIVEHFIEPDPEEYVSSHIYSELEGRYKDLQIQLEALTQDRKLQDSQIRDLGAKLAQLSQHEIVLANAREQQNKEKKKADSLSYKVLDLKEEILSLQIRLTETQRDEEELWSKNSKLSHERENFEKENKALKIALERTSPEAIAATDAKLKKYTDLQKKNERLESEIAQYNLTIEELTERLDAFMGFDQDGAKAQIKSELKREFSKRWQQEKKKQVEQAISQENQIRELSLAEISELKNEISDLERDNERLQTQLKEMKSEHAELINEQELGYQTLKSELEARLERDREDYMELVKRRENEIEALGTKIVELESERETLLELSQSKVDRKDNSSDQYKVEINDLKTKLIKSQKEVATLKKAYSEMATARKKLLSIVEANKNDKTSEVIKQQLEAQNKKLSAEQQQHHELKLKYKKSSIQIQKYKEKLEEAASIIDKLKDKSKLKNDEISKLKSEMQKLAEAPTQLLNTNELGLNSTQAGPTEVVDQGPSEEEMAKLIGDSFEVPNLAEWKIKTEEGIQGPYTYAEMLELKNTRLINDKTQIKKKAEGTWKSLRDFFELSTNVLTHKVTVDGEVVTKYYIKRGSFRAPFYEVCSFDLGGNELRGHCTSLSIGGAFIELARIESVDALREKKIFVRFSRGSLNAPFGVQAVIKNVSEARPKGIGVMFVDLPEHGKEAIIDYINNYLEKLGNSAA